MFKILTQLYCTIPNSFVRWRGAMRLVRTTIETIRPCANETDERTPAELANISESGSTRWLAFLWFIKKNHQIFFLLQTTWKNQNQKSMASFYCGVIPFRNPRVLGNFIETYCIWCEFRVFLPDWKLGWPLAMWSPEWHLENLEKCKKLELT